MQETPEQYPVAAAEHVFNVRRRLALFLTVLTAISFILIIISGSQVSALSTEGRDTGEDFSKFSHTQTHGALPCLLCHRREDNSPRPNLPGHTPCAGCHTQRFKDSNNPICTICHTDAGSGAVKAFPRIKSFNMRFEHAPHTGGAARTATGCAACHKPERRGVALSIPAGLSAHSTCFQCHTPSARGSNGQDISSCSTCHSQGSFMRTGTQADAYKVNFSHARHNRSQRLSCNDCHNVRAGMPQSKQVTAPQPLMHHAAARAQSCATCHNNRRAFGIENFGDCKKCHQGAHFYF
jgi:c(7)-type cytochrome triheme protein